MFNFWFLYLKFVPCKERAKKSHCIRNPQLNEIFKKRSKKQQPMQFGVIALSFIYVYTNNKTSSN